MERAQTKIVAALFGEMDIGTDHIDDGIPLPYLFNDLLRIEHNSP